MKFKIRNSVFETNSSSMHSICIMKEIPNEKYCDPYERRLYIGSTETYERTPFKVIFDLGDKLNFLLANKYQKSEGYNKKETKEILDYYLKLIQKHYPEVKEFRHWFKEEYPCYCYLYYDPDVLYSVDSEEVIQKYNDINDDWDYVLEETDEVLNYFFDYDDPHIYFGQCYSNILDRFLEEEGITEEDFLFDQRYFVVIDGDEYRIFDNMIKNGVITNIKKRYCEADGDFCEPVEFD